MGNLDIKIIKNIYGRLLGLHASVQNTKSITLDDASFWEDLNQTVLELEQQTNQSYKLFNITPYDGYNGLSVSMDAYRAKVSQLIGQLHAEHFSDHPDPFSGGPSTVINTSQTVSQEVNISLTQIQKTITEKLQNNNLKPEEKSFLEELNNSMSGISNATDIFNKLAGLAIKHGLTLEKISTIFS